MGIQIKFDSKMGILEILVLKREFWKFLIGKYKFLYIVDLEINILEILNQKITIFGFSIVFTCNDTWKFIDIIRKYQ